MLAYVTWARPAIILFENVEDIADPDSSTGCSNLDVVLAEFSSRGYECQQMTGNASAYGVPQRRVRLYLVAVLVVANSQFNFLQNSVGNTFRTLRALLKVCARSPPCASEVIYKAYDHRVSNFFAVETRGACQQQAKQPFSWECHYNCRPEWRELVFNPST